MNKIGNILINRNFLLISALVLGFLLPQGGELFAPYTIYFLAIVMSFSTTGIKLKMLVQFKSVSRISLEAMILNYLVHGVIILLLAWFFTDKYLFYGFVVIAATPPGVAIIPFTHIFKGDIDYSFKGLLGTYLLSIIFTPLIITLFTQGEHLSAITLIIFVIKIIIAPLAASRLLLLKPIKPITDKVRGHVVNFGFALIIYTAIALNSGIILSNPNAILFSALILFAAIFLTGIIFLFIYRRSMDAKTLISRNLMLTIKSSGFAVATALALFDSNEAAIPAAIMSIFVLLYLIFIDVLFKKMKIGRND